MGSAGIDDSSQKAIEPDLVDVGNKLLSPPSSTDELLVLLDRAESLLAKVWQQPPRSTGKALIKTMQALITADLLHNDDSNIQIAVASCCNELTRISAPNFPYEDDIMREIFQLFVVALEQLSCKSGRNYDRALHIVETIAKVRSCLMLLDVGTDELVVEMFQLFLNNIGSSHPSDVFDHMETIMTLMIKESEDISFELLRPLLDSVNMKNKDILPVSWELGKRVFENCEAKLQCYLKEAVKAMNLDFDDYAEIVAHICHDTTDENKLVPKDVSPTAAGGASQTDGLSKAVYENCSPQADDEKLDTEKALETLKDSHQILQSETGKGALQKRRRRRKPSHEIRREEYERSPKTGDMNSHEGSPGYNEEKEDLALTSDLGNSSKLSNSLQKKIDFCSKVSLPKNGQAKKKMSMINQHKDLDLSLLKRNNSKLKERGYDVSKKTGKRDITGLSKKRMEKEGGTIGDRSKEGKHQISPQEPSEGKEIISHKNMDKFPKSNRAKGNTGKEKKRRRLGIEHGAELVNLRILVWWPMDKEFYAGTVNAFDPETKTHTILYDDGEKEILNLGKERWKPFGNMQQPPQMTDLTKPLEKQEAGHSSPPRELIKTQEKNIKRKASTLKKQQQNTASSSKRSKDEKRRLSKSKDSSSPVSHQVVAESDEEMQKTNVSAKDEGENHMIKEENTASSSKRSKGEKRTLSKSKDSFSPVFHQVVAESDEEMHKTKVSAEDEGENHMSKEESEILIKKTETNNIQ